MEEIIYRSNKKYWPSSSINEAETQMTENKSYPGEKC